MFHNLVNTEYFKEAGNDFVKNGGLYTRAPIGSKENKDYWDLQEERCRVGYKVGDMWIPGRYYHYLNFFPMWKVPDSLAIAAFEERRDYKGKISKKTAEKILDFPRFNEMQYEWFKFKHIAWHGGTFLGQTSEGGEHICCAKTRGAGFSYMEAQDGVYNYTFIPGSKSYYFASRDDYLTKDGIMNKVGDALDFTNKYQFEWKQNRQKKDTMLHRKASYLDDYGDEHGSMSEIMGVIVDDPEKVRGKRGKKITFEESGSFKRLEKALEIALGSARDGDFQVGQATVFGTGGEEGPSIQGLQNIFDHPKGWGFMEFDNIWENSGSDSKVGYFVPSFRANFSHTDKDGNIDYKSAIKYDNEQRELKKLTGKPKDLDRRKAEYPQTPAELFTRLDQNDFNVTLINKQIRKVLTSTSIKALLRHGTLEYSEDSKALGGIEFHINPKANPITQYPHNDSDDLTGCVTIAQRPWLDQHGKVPFNMYKLVFDAYYKDESEDKTSLFDIRVFKQDNPYDNSYSELPIAWYTARPQRLSECHATLFKLCKYFNCTAQGEISGGGQGVVDYAKQHQLLQWLDFEPEMLHNKELASNQRNRSYLMNMNTERKRLGMTYMVQWHEEPRGVTDAGIPIVTIDRCYDVGFLRELARGGVNNSDRMSSTLIYMFCRKERLAQAVQNVKKQTDFFSRPLFVEHSNVSERYVDRLG